MSNRSQPPAQPSADQKKGEVNELRTLLRAINAERNVDATTNRKKVSLCLLPSLLLTLLLYLLKTSFIHSFLFYQFLNQSL